MQFYMPTKLYFEENCVLRHAEELAQFGKKALIVTGPHSAKVNGSLQDVTQALTQQGISYCVFDQIEENPSLETVTKAAAFGRQVKAKNLILNHISNRYDFLDNQHYAEVINRMRELAAVVFLKRCDE